MSQSDFGTIDPNTKSGATLATDLNAWRDALHSLHKGAARPSYVAAGTLWIDDAATPWLLKLYDGADDITLGSVNATTNEFIPYSAGTALGTWSLKAASVLSKTSSYTVVTADNGKLIRCNTTSCSWSLFLPPAATAGDGFRFEVQSIGTSENFIQINPNGAELINGASTLDINQGKGAIIWCDGTAWHAIVTARGITLATEQPSTSGTSIDFTGIPAGTKRITIMFVDVSTSGVSKPYLQLGDAGGIETTGYAASSSNVQSTSSAVLHTTGFAIFSADAANKLGGNIILTLENSTNFTWTVMGILAHV